MIIAAGFLIPMDMIYRVTRRQIKLFHPSGGGELFFVPIWIWGWIWSGLGAYYLASGG